MQINDNVLDFMTTWLESLLFPEREGSSVVITAAYRLGALAWSKTNYPRDILTQFQLMKDKEKILSLARHQGALKFNEHRIIALLDLPPEILQKRKLLKPITDHLKNKNIQFRWSLMSDIIVARNGAQYRAEDVPSGKTLLEALELPLPPD